MTTIAFDAKRAFNNFTGLGNYSRLVIDLLHNARPQWNYLLYTPKIKRNAPVIPALDDRRNKVITPGGPLAGLYGSVWRTWGLTHRLKNDGVSLFHGLSNELPLNIHRSGIPSVVTVHDVIFRHFPQYYKPVDRKIYDYKFREACRIATLVIAISECTKRDIMEFYDIPEAKIDVVYQGCDAQFHDPVSADDVRRMRELYNLHNPYIIGVGTVEPRKNQLLTVKALKGLPSDIHAVIVGRNARGYGDEIMRYATENGVANRVHMLSGIPFAHFPALYAGAVLSSYPSRFEGFGIPVIESLSMGTPVIVAKGSCLEEAAGPDAPAIDPDDPDAFIHHASQIIHSDAVRDRLVARGRDYITRFTHDNCVEGILQTYQKALR